MQNRLLHKRTILLLVLALSATRIPLCSECLAQRPGDDVTITSAIRGLRSSSEDQRQKAKAEFIQIGAKAIPALMALLEDLIKRPQAPRFVTGKEKEGEEAWSNLDSTPPQPDQVRNLMNLDISWRLNADVCELLGRLHALEAVPLLLQTMEEREEYFGTGRMGFEMKALVEIGEPAIPQIVALFEAADSKAASLRFGDPQPSLEDQITYKRGYAAIIRARAAIVLGEIGSVDALPALKESLQKQPRLGWGPDLPYIEQAIAKIEAQNSQR